MKAHNRTWAGEHIPEWRDAQAPDLVAGRTTGRLRGCSWCGSMHPADLAAAIRAGATGSWADFKYGWPHKWYVDGVPNPHAGMLESRMGASHAVPVCPMSGMACIHGAQSFDRPSCVCMKGDTLSVVEGHASGVAVERAPAGFCSVTGAPQHTWRRKGEPAAARTWGKFYTEHLQDATPEDRETIERAMGINFNFASGDKVSWARFVGETME